MDAIRQVISSARQEEIKREVWQLRFKRERDRRLADEAERIVNQLQFVL